MKNLVFIFIAIFFISCEKKELINDSDQQMKATSAHESRGIENGIKNLPQSRPIIRLTFSGGLGTENSCKGGKCGMCPGICIRFEARVGVITPAEVKDKMNYVDMEVVGDKIKMIPHQTIDNGDGYTRIPEASNLGSQVARYLKKKNIVILPGTYAIDYSNHAFGEVLFDAIIE
jgi:hypothetical protein